MAAAMVAATPSGSWAKQFSRSAETGTSTAPASSPACASTSSLVMAPSRRPRVAAKPPLVVAIASKPREANNAADPMSQALGMSSGVPGTWRERNRSARCRGEAEGAMPHRSGMRARKIDQVAAGTAGSGNSQYWNSIVIGSR